VFPFGYVINGLPLHEYLDYDEAIVKVECELPEIPPEVHNIRPINPSVCMAAIRAMCGEGR
jgi:hypothetical protein